MCVSLQLVRVWPTVRTDFLEEVTLIWISLNHLFIEKRQKCLASHRGQSAGMLVPGCGPANLAEGTHPRKVRVKVRLRSRSM